jgi:hypothetical protein
VYPPRGRFRHAVNRVGLLATQTDLDYARVVLDQLAHGFPAESPQLRKFANAKVFLGLRSISTGENLLAFADHRSSTSWLSLPAMFSPSGVGSGQRQH